MISPTHPTILIPTCFYIASDLSSPFIPFQFFVELTNHMLIIIYYYCVLSLPFLCFLYLVILSCGSYITNYLMLPAIRCSSGMESPRYLYVVIHIVHSSVLLLETEVSYSILILLFLMLTICSCHLFL